MVHNRSEMMDIEEHDNIFPMSVEMLVTQKLSLIQRKIENRKKIEKLNKISCASENVLIMLQDDPDPDALASGLALRVLLGRNKQTAPIGSFGEVSRSENINMVRLLDIPVVKVDPGILHTFSTIAMVDVQPPYFKGLDIRADIVIDHHPCNEKYHAQYSDVRTHYGAASTILGQYLIDQNCKITQRLATALVYGIKTDTMFLERDISLADIEVFTSLYPIANRNMLRHIEHATLEYSEINGFIKALKNIKIIENALFSFLGRVHREDIIPRLADFCLQIGESEWSFVTGIFNENYVCCVRNVGYVKHAGELVSRAFGTVGRGGGHRSMAKVVIPVKEFKKHYSCFAGKDAGTKIMEIFINTMEKVNKQGT